MLRQLEEVRRDDAYCKCLDLGFELTHDEIMLTVDGLLEAGRDLPVRIFGLQTRKWFYMPPSYSNLSTMLMWTKLSN